MSYDISLDCTDVDAQGVFQDIRGILGITMAAEARNPEDGDDYVIPQGTPMAPVHMDASDEHADGNAHTPGYWMPIRRSLITAVDTTAVTVVDANPFHVGDMVHSIDATGPVTGAGLDLGIVTAVNYTTGIVTVQFTAAAAVANDWLEVMENGVAYGATPSRWMNPMTVGMMKDDTDVRMKADDTTGTISLTDIVIHGAIKEGDINFPDDASDDLILIVQMGGGWNLGGGIRIITPTHGGEAVDVPDWSDLAT